ncbi:glutathione S-transferase [Acetobacter sp. TBRC 12305]|uniref:Glutathione S-transferase n=1 Tax=Acetobacter garciniae TaxID=2817435 RepID=A0A939HLG4_9PROT|nr:glutathione S-transferase [Acetobacter garciniae]MBO1325682.1 glutathione S-transferase [Acetobacter garciniae]MBX0345582.1 glutathione S-transferase [Acetobacter garciniae]
MLLYDLDASGNCYKIRLFAALTNTKLDLVPVDLASGENHDPDFRKLNPFGEVPVLVDGDFTLRDSQAILVYLAARLANRAWWPEDAMSQATITQWLSVASSEVRNGPNAARLIHKFGDPLDMGTAMHWTDKLLPVLNAHVETQDWFALRRPTIADCALFPYLALAPEGGISLTPYPALMRWLDRVRDLPGFIPVPGLYGDC